MSLTLRVPRYVEDYLSDNKKTDKKATERQCDTTSINKPSLRAQHNQQHMQAAHLKKHRHHDPPWPPASSGFNIKC